MRPVERAILFGANPPERSTPDEYDALKNSKSVSLPEGDYDVFGDGSVVVKPAYGHTPGHSVLYVKLAKTGPVEDGGWSAFHTNWSGLDQFDPAVHVWIRGNGRAASRGWPDSPRLEALRNEWLLADGDDARTRIAGAIQEQVFVDVPYIPVGQFMARTVYRRVVTDVLSGYALFWNLRKG